MHALRHGLRRGPGIRPIDRIGDQAVIVLEATSAMMIAPSTTR